MTGAREHAAGYAHGSPAGTGRRAAAGRPCRGARLGAAAPATVALLLAVVMGPGALRAQCPDGTPQPCGRATERAARGVAVLEFLNESRDSSDAYLAAGFTDEITSRLSQLGRLVVTSRTAVRRLPRAELLTPQALGRALHVAYLVSGGVRRGVGRVRISVELLRASTGVTVWSSQYDRADGDVLAIEEDLAVAVAGAIAGRLLPAERALLAEGPTRNAAAYDHFLRGNYYLAHRTADASRRAIAEYQAATAQDPGFVRARARAAYAYGLYLDWGWPYPGLPDDSLVARGMREADLVLQQDSLLSDGWMARAYLLSHRDPRSFAAAEAAFRRAIALDPANAEAYHQYAWILMISGRDSAAAANYHRALAIDPARAITLDELSLIYLVERRYAESLAWQDSALAIDSGAFWTLNDRAHTRMLLGDWAGARADAEQAQRLGPQGFTYWGEAVLAILAVREGDTAQGRGIAARLAEDIEDPRRPTVQQARWIGATLAAVGEREAALDFLERVPAERRGAELWFFLQFPELDALRDEPRFRQMLASSRPAGAVDR
ncbi:MAG TPA: tetratricopeptide repeat protein [Gemmatimonadales bacterium]|nr:tetratricopeptide repeat protein [Gemmatimonadales bacterium]